jgi:hypothetical protein
VESQRRNDKTQKGGTFDMGYLEDLLSMVRKKTADETDQGKAEQAMEENKGLMLLHC